MSKETEKIGHHIVMFSIYIIILFALGGIAGLLKWILTP